MKGIEGEKEVVKGGETITRDGLVGGRILAKLKTVQGRAVARNMDTVINLEFWVKLNL